MITITHCGNFITSLSRFLNKNSVKSTILSKNYSVNWLHEIFFHVVNYIHTHNVETCTFFPHDFLKFRQINFFTQGFYCKSIWRKILQWGKITEITTLWYMVMKNMKIFSIHIFFSFSIEVKIVNKKRFSDYQWRICYLGLFWFYDGWLFPMPKRLYVMQPIA